MKASKKYYAISVKEENHNTGNHTIGVHDWRWHDKYVMFNMKDGSQAKVSTKELNAYLLQDKYAHLRSRWIDVVNKETGEAEQKKVWFWLVPDAYITTHNKA